MPQGHEGAAIHKERGVPRMQTVFVQRQGQEKEVIRQQGLRVTQSPGVCMNSACAGAADGHRELHTVAVRKNEHHRSWKRQGEWRVKASRPTTRAEKQKEQDQEQ